MAASWAPSSIIWWLFTMSALPLLSETSVDASLSEPNSLKRGTSFRRGRVLLLRGHLLVLLRSKSEPEGGGGDPGRALRFVELLFVHFRSQESYLTLESTFFLVCFALALVNLLRKAPVLLFL
jgi:hypothetical protein